ncbi:MAG TPA: zinc ribbon domain-containing protein [bacterium]|nr:zinc ribbon domain-containing protein [bacterium]HOH09107.1 zinc ribbon domain-containing protein [bacterium]HPG83193.1 zinc ribbon domain-containing protein [bacterium]HPM58302.1 zinc ribbon domain-containing protein [bacterium]
MPIYEYRCSDCGHRFEVFQRMGADGSDLQCPLCAAPKPEKLFSAIAASSKSGSSGCASPSPGCGSGGFS